MGMERQCEGGEEIVEIPVTGIPVTGNLGNMSLGVYLARYWRGEESGKKS